MCLRQIGSPRLLYGVGEIGGDHEPLHIVVESDAVGDGLRDGGGEFLEVCCGALLSVEGSRHHVDHHLPDRCCGWSFGFTLDGAEQLMERILINRSEVQSICCANNLVGDLRADNQCNRGRYRLL